MKNILIILVVIALIGVTIFAMKHATTTTTGQTSIVSPTEHGGVLGWVSGLNLSLFGGQS